MTIYEETKYIFNKFQLNGKEMTVKEYLETREFLPSHEIIEETKITNNNGIRYDRVKITVEALKEKYLNANGSWFLYDDEWCVDAELGRMKFNILQFIVKKENE